MERTLGQNLAVAKITDPVLSFNQGNFKREQD